MIQTVDRVLIATKGKLMPLGILHSRRVPPVPKFSADRSDHSISVKFAIAEGI